MGSEPPGGGLGVGVGDLAGCGAVGWLSVVRVWAGPGSGGAGDQAGGGIDPGDSEGGQAEQLQDRLGYAGVRAPSRVDPRGDRAGVGENARQTNPLSG